MADYLFFRIKSKILNDPSPYVIFVDELNKYLASEQFAPKLKETASSALRIVFFPVLPKAIAIFDSVLSDFGNSKHSLRALAIIFVSSSSLRPNKPFTQDCKKGLYCASICNGLMF
jgi:hypothetical protein